MSNRTYLAVCLAVTVIVAGAILFVPGLSEAIEQNLLGFLSRNAS